MVKYTVCNCPRCNHLGISVAAMHYKETQQWHKSGSFSGSGGVVGTFGIGLGSGNGSYSENGEAATKRANTFSAPERISLSSDAIVLGALMTIVALVSVPFMLDLAQAMGNNAHVPIENMSLFFKVKSLIQQYWPFVALPLMFILILKLITGVKKVEQQESLLNQTIYPKQLARYNELRYCENCNSIYDHNAYAEDANEIGMNKMMSIEPSSQ